MKLDQPARQALKWGAFIGLANLIWLYAAYYLGLHTRGIAVFQWFMFGWLVLTVAGYLLTMHSITQKEPAMRYLRGLGLGALAALVSAVIAVIAQVGYFKVVHPAWPEVMAQQTRDHFTAEGLPPAEIDVMMEQARGFFTLGYYAINSAVTAFVMGVAICAVTMIFLRPRTPPGAP